MRSILAVMHLATPQKISFAQGQTNWPLPRVGRVHYGNAVVGDLNSRMQKKVCMLSWVSLVLGSSIG